MVSLEIYKWIGEAKLVPSEITMKTDDRQRRYTKPGTSDSVVNRREKLPGEPQTRRTPAQTLNNTPKRALKTERPSTCHMNP